MQAWRIILLITLLIVFIPTYTLMKKVEVLKKQGDSAELQQKQKQLKWCTRLLIAVFIITLIITMARHYINIAKIM